MLLPRAQRRKIYDSLHWSVTHVWLGLRIRPLQGLNRKCANARTWIGMTSALGWSCIFLHEAFWPHCLFWQCHQLRLQSVFGWSCIFLHGASLNPLPLLATPPNCDLKSVIWTGVVEHLLAQGLLASLPLLAMPPTCDLNLNWVVGHLFAQGLLASLPLLAMPQTMIRRCDIKLWCKIVVA